MIFLVLIFVFQIFFGGMVPHVFLPDTQANLLQGEEAVRQGPVVVFSESSLLPGTQIAAQSVAQFEVEIANTPLQRARGLMFQESLPEDHGMLFVFDDAAVRSFWMKNMLIPLDMIFVDLNGNVVSELENVRPCAEIMKAAKVKTCPTYSSIFPVRYVLEINAGLAQSRHIQVGSRMDILIP